MRPPHRSTPGVLAIGALFALPVLHPLLIPLVGVPSHLLWFVHVLPVALFTYRFGRTGAVRTLVVSAGLVVAGERLFGAGWGRPAAWETALALGVSVTFANTLVVGFALYARGVTERYEALFDRVRMGVIRVAADGRVEQVNPEAEEILDTSGDRLRGRTLTELFESPRFVSMDEMVRAGAWSGRMELRTDGRSRHLHAFLATVAHPDGLGHQVLLADRSLEVLQGREIERQSKLAALGEALAGVAHELNNPLAVIIANAQLGTMDGDPDPSEASEILETIEEQADRMKELVAELLGFSRPDDGESTRLGTLLERIVRVQRMALGRQVRLELDTGWTGELPVSPTKVEQIVLNLVSNAAYEVGGDGGTVAVLTRDLGDAVAVEVLDDGPGIDEEVLPTLFQPFVTTKPPGEGTGLGLAISRRLARGWGGELEATNRPEGGARFVLRIPKRRSDGRPTELPPADPGAAPEPVPA